MKQFVKSIFKSFGYDLVRHQPVGRVQPRNSQKTDRLTLHETATGKYYLPTDVYQDVVANTIINNGIFEEDVVNCARQYIKPGTTVLDVGCNFGQMSILFSKMTGPSGKVYSFDADDFVFEVFKKNVAVNECNNIQPVFGAVHNQQGATLYFPDQDFKKFSAYGSYGIDYNTSQGREVKAITIDSLDIQTRVSFMKIDIQGGDLLAMKGAINTIRKNKMPILFEFEYQLQDEFKLDFQEYVDFVLEIGYKFERIIYGYNFLVVPKN